MPGWKLEIRTDLERHSSKAHSGYKTCPLHCFHDRKLNADKNVNRLESRKLRTTPGCDAGPHVLWCPGVLCAPRDVTMLELKLHDSDKELFF